VNDYFIEYDEVLENKLGISDLTELKNAEAKICYLRQIEIEAEPLPRKLGFNFLLSLNLRLFGDIYEFAGEIRTVNILLPEKVIRE